MTKPPVNDATTCGVTNPQLVPLDAEPAWADIVGVTPDGILQTIAHYHLPCGSASGTAQTMPDGSTRHICRACAAHAATGPKEAKP